MEIVLPNSEKASANNEDIFKTLIEESPSPVGLYVGNDMVIRLANKAIIAVWGKDASVIGLPLAQALPELDGQPFLKILDDVYTTGITYQATEDLVNLVVDGTLNTYYFNFTYKPLTGTDGKVWGILNTATDVTELVTTRQRLEESEKRIAFALEAAEIGTWELDPVNNMVKWDDRCKQLYGFSKEDIVPYEEVLKYVHDDDRNRVNSAVKRAMDPQTDGQYEVEFRTIGAEDGLTRWLLCKGKAYFTDNKPYRFAGTAVDISKEVSNREEQQKLIALVENSVDLVGVTDISGDVIYLNKAGLEMMGLSSLDEACRPAYEYFMPDELPLLQTTVNKGIAEQGHWAGEVCYRNFKTGEEIPAHLNAFALNDPITGTPTGFASVTRDMRPEKAIQKALAESGKLFKNITVASPAALWMTDTQFSITYVNQIWINWTGRPLENQLGTGWLDAVLEEDRQKAIDKFVKDFEARRFHESQFRINHFDTGTIRWIICTGNAQYNDEGEFTGYIGACVDITELKQLQNQKDEFIGIASHELKTPVTSIKAYTQVLEAMLIKRGDMKEAGMIGKMGVQINRLTSLIGDLLDVTKINSGRLQFNQSWFDFNQMITEVVEELQRTTDTHTLVEDFRANVNVYADRDRISQVITNLITNAIKYSPKSDKIIISAELKDGEVNVCVEDFGIGISEDKLEKVFEQFYRVSGDKQHTFPGLGLGLYIASETIKREGGKIWVNSIEGQGSTFCFSLPVDQVQNRQHS